MIYFPVCHKPRRALNATSSDLLQEQQGAGDNTTCTKIFRGNLQMTSSPHEITKLLKYWTGGDQAALDQLMPLVYDELHRLAHQHMRRENPGHMLQTSALINEAYLRLVEDQPKMRWENRTQFLDRKSTRLNSSHSQ